MTQIPRIATLTPLAIGVLASARTILIHSIPLNGTVSAVRRERKLGHAGVGFWSDFAIVALSIA